MEDWNRAALSMPAGCLLWLALLALGASLGSRVLLLWGTLLWPDQERPGAKCPPGAGLCHPIGHGRKKHRFSRLLGSFHD